MAPFDGRLRRPVLAACFCGRCRTCMGRTAADHRRRGFKRRTSASRGSEALPRQTALEAVLPHGCAQKFDGRSAEVLDDDHSFELEDVSARLVSAPNGVLALFGHQQQDLSDLSDRLQASLSADPVAVSSGLASVASLGR